MRPIYVPALFFNSMVEFWNRRSIREHLFSFRLFYSYFFRFFFIITHTPVTRLRIAAGGVFAHFCQKFKFWPLNHAVEASDSAAAVAGALNPEGGFVGNVEDASHNEPSKTGHRERKSPNPTWITYRQQMINACIFYHAFMPQERTNCRYFAVLYHNWSYVCFVLLSRFISFSKRFYF